MIAILLASAIGGAFPAPSVNSVDIQIGGVTSGPSRRYVDLDAGVLFVGDPPAGARGDGAGVATKDLKVSSRSSVGADSLARLRKLAKVVLEDGAESRKLCPPIFDRMVSLNVSGPTQTVAGPVYCPSEEAETLIDTVFRIGR